MFAGSSHQGPSSPRRSSILTPTTIATNNVRLMQIFHELKAQFPAVPDHVISACVATHVASRSALTGSTGNLYDLVRAAADKEHQNQMGRPSIQLQKLPSLPPPTSTSQPVEQKTITATPHLPEDRQIASDRSRSSDMNTESDISDINRNQVKHLNNNISTNNNNNSDPNDGKVASPSSDVLKSSDTNKPSGSDKVIVKRPSSLQLSEKCRDVFKLLNSPVLTDKPPRSPLGAKRFPAKQVPNRQDSPTPKKETVSTPTQTTDTLVNNTPLTPLTSPSLNLSLNVNCQMGLVQSPLKPRCTSRFDLTPSQPWLSPNPFPSDQESPRSFTSVNLTLRPPTSTPQDPIDITSQNSSLTYSTSSFDKEKGLQSMLQITVGPGNAGSVSSVRARPKSFHVGDSPMEMVPVRAGSMSDLSALSSEGPVLLKQQARIDRLKIELQNGNSRLVIMRQEVEDLEKKRRQVPKRKTIEEMEKQFKKEIDHLTDQCGQLADMLDKTDEFYNIYTGQSGPLLSTQPTRPAQPTRPSPPPPRPPRIQIRNRLPYPDRELERWNCSMCTFLNHPFLDKCEACDMTRVTHVVSASPGDNIHIRVTPRFSHSWVT